jgi:hypothetical protein
MTNPRLILDTSACCRIQRSSKRKEIEVHFETTFRGVVSVQTLWELMDRISGGDGSHFLEDQQAFNIAAGRRHPRMLPMPIAYAIETVLKLPRPKAALNPESLLRMYTVITRATSRDELYSGVALVRGAKQLTVFAPDIVRQQQREGEEAHVKRLKWAQCKKVVLPSADKWASDMVKRLGISLDAEQSHRLGESLDAAYRFDMEIWRLATAPKSSYKPENHQNDWCDLQQTMYLCDPSIHLITADNPLCKKICASQQANRVHYLPDYLAMSGLSI